MLQIVDKIEMAERKPYRYSRKTLEKMERIRKEKKIKKEKMAKNIITINMLKELVCDDLHSDILHFHEKVLIL